MGNCQKSEESPYLSYTFLGDKYAYITIFKCHNLYNKKSILFIHVDDSKQRGMKWNYDNKMNDELAEYIRFLIKSKMDDGYLCHLKPLPDGTRTSKIESSSTTQITLKSNIGFSEITTDYDNLLSNTTKLLTFLGNIDDVIPKGMADIY